MSHFEHDGPVKADLKHDMVFLDPDLRGNPGSDCCYICLRRVSLGRAIRVLIGDEVCHAIHPDDADSQEYTEVVVIGPECGRIIPEAYRLK
ncbi:MAG: hypothetical protein MJH10_09200 [Epibacterium sp.]|nr:hypothetical protein [Epibacterium sp.]NQX73711.1 hypothetical protein [Epibacterium sp.]